MYTISKMNSGKWFGECLEDGYYYENDSWGDVQEKMEEHEELID